MSAPPQTVSVSVLKMIKFNVAEINRCTVTEGPYKRLTIWFQGCDLSCDGCFNRDFKTLEIKNLISLDRLLSIIRESRERYGIEGVTYLGGEPTIQIGLSELSRSISEMGLGIIAFTGHAYESVKERLKWCDLVIDGRFDNKQLDYERRLIGSKNQRIISLTERYSDKLDWFISDGKVEMDVNVGSAVFANGDGVL